MEQTFKIYAPEGMHARPASELVKLVKSFAPAKVSIANAVKTVNASSMLSILSLGLTYGSEVTVRIEGNNEESLMAQLKQFFETMQ